MAEVEIGRSRPRPGKIEVMESKKSGRHCKIEERGAHSIDRMVGRKTSERRLNQGKVRHGPEQSNKRNFTSMGRTPREVRHAYTNNDGLENKRSTMVEGSTKKTQFEMERSTPKAFLLLEMGSADRGVQRIQRRRVSRCKEKPGMAGRSTGQNRMEMTEREKAR